MTVVNLDNAGVVLGRDAARPALQSVNLQVRAGERVALVGANGSGKSTLLRLMHGLLDPSSGSVVRDTTLRHAMLFQRPFLLRLSVQTNIVLGLWLRGTPLTLARAQALIALERVGLVHLAQRNASTLSGGEQQRVALARACGLSPQVLLLDEPTASLDPRAKREVEALVHDYVRQDPSLTLIFSSHNLGQVKRLATRVVYLEEGRILADLPVADFFGGDRLQKNHPEAHLFVKGELV